VYGCVDTLCAISNVELKRERVAMALLSGMAPLNASGLTSANRCLLPGSDAEFTGFACDATGGGKAVRLFAHSVPAVYPHTLAASSSLA